MNVIASLQTNNKNCRLYNKWRAVYNENCKCGSVASIRKPTIVIWQGV